MTNVTGKVWGDTSAIIQNALVELHKINVKAGFRCSEHLHEHKWNGFYVESGVLEIHVRKNNYELTDVTVLRAGDFTSVRPGEYHFFVCTEACSALELYWPELLSEDIKRKNTGGPMAPKVTTLKEPVDYEYDTGRIIPKWGTTYTTNPLSMAASEYTTVTLTNNPMMSYDADMHGEYMSTMYPNVKCNSICKLGDNGKCVGCGRSLEEITQAGLKHKKE